MYIGKRHEAYNLSLQKGKGQFNKYKEFTIIYLRNNNWNWRRIIPGSDGTSPLLGKVQLKKGRSRAADGFANVGYKSGNI
jgi:hypothetical protein